MRVLKEIIIVSTRLLASLMCRSEKKDMHREVIKLKIAFSVFSLFRFDSRISLTAALTNMKLGREIKSCVPTNIVLVKVVNNVENRKHSLGQCILMVYVYTYVYACKSDHGR